MELHNTVIRFLHCIVLLAVCLNCNASPLFEQFTLTQERFPFAGEAERYVLPLFDTFWSDRFKEIWTNREGYQYGPPLLGNTSYFPTGTLGDAMVLRDKELWMRDVQYVTENVNNKELPKASQALAAVGLFLGRRADKKLIIARLVGCRIFLAMLSSTKTSGKPLSRTAYHLEY